MTHTSRPTPDLSVVVIVPDRFETLTRTLEALATQDARDRLEIVFVTPVPSLAVPPGIAPVGEAQERSHRSGYE